MAIFDFLFGRTKAQPTTTTTVQTSKLPEEIAPFVTQVLEEAKADFEKVVVIGVDKDGSLSIRSSVADGAEILWYLKVGEHTLMDVVMNS